MHPSAIPNFFKKPNGVFYIGYGTAGILETERFLAERPKANFATQSGPMLIIDGAIHPAFIVNSTDRKMRNGVGVTSPTEVHFVITKDRVSFYEFARFPRRPRLQECPLSRRRRGAPGLYAPELAEMTRPAMAAMGLSSQWWTRLLCPQTIRLEGRLAIPRRGRASNRRGRSCSWPSPRRLRSRWDAAGWSGGLSFASRS